MEALPLHAKLVHLPIALAVLMPLLTSGLLFAWWRDWYPKRTWALAVVAQALLFVSAWFAMNTGSSEEERVERFVPEQAIEVHEEAAETFLWGSGLVLALVLLPLLLKKRQAAHTAAGVAIVGTAVVLLLGFRVGEAGGALVYRYGAAAAYADGGKVVVPSGKEAGVREAEESRDH